MQVMLLAAGKSTRLGELGAVLPKPLVPICGYPAITFALALCRRAGLTDVVVNLHHHGELIRQALGDGSDHGVTIRYSEEIDLLGTGGGIARARSLFKPGPVLVMNGKVVADIDLATVVAAHRGRRPAPPPPWCCARTRTSTSGLRLASTPPAGGQPAPAAHRSHPVGAITDRMFTGIHILEPSLMDRLPPTGVSDVIAEAYLPALRAGARIQSLTMTGYFAEHSTPERYLDGNLALLRKPDLVSRPPGPLVGIDPDASVHPRARILMPVRIAPAPPSRRAPSSAPWPSSAPAPGWSRAPGWSTAWSGAGWWRRGR
jgi:NDP-sugar pyrophosphorylase family protein